MLKWHAGPYQEGITGSMGIEGQAKIEELMHTSKKGWGLVVGMKDARTEELGQNLILWRSVCVWGATSGKSTAFGKGEGLKIFLYSNLSNYGLKKKMDRRNIPVS